MLFLRRRHTYSKQTNENPLRKGLQYSAILKKSFGNSSPVSYPDVSFFSVFFTQLMTVQTVVAFHLIAAVRITFFARARVVTLENVNLIVQVRYRNFIGEPWFSSAVSIAIFKLESKNTSIGRCCVIDNRKRTMAGEMLKRKRKSQGFLKYAIQISLIFASWES